MQILFQEDLIMIFHDEVDNEISVKVKNERYCIWRNVLVKSHFGTFDVWSSEGQMNICKEIRFQF